uniref:Reverse transcriptase Ty1/copia-type domain-containing protein n=1 Tax=Cajanus cajan TaxID=3821 RepID=A0A151SLM1_CAJCA|nr:hypothetical protein KK1_001934 [Cajanus cajan]
MDDIVLTGISLEEFSALKTVLHNDFGIKDLGVLKFFMGVEVAHFAQGISICQKQYCLDLLANFGMLGCKPVNTPSKPGTHLVACSSAEAEYYRVLATPSCEFQQLKFLLDDLHVHCSK